MRLLLLALLVLPALAAVAPTAAACHPSLAWSSPDGSTAVSFDMGCGHVPPYHLCARVAGHDALCQGVP